MSRDRKGPFFIGFLPAPKELRAFLIVSALSMMAMFGFVGWVVASGQPDPGDARFLGGRQTLVGVLEAYPYPMVHVTEGSNRVKAGTTVLLSGQGKRGVAGRAEPLDGALVRLSGQALERGDLQMIQLAGGMRGLSAMMDDDSREPLPVAEDLGRWQLKGEICDGKCLAGAMRPGTGLAHRACANLCLIGGVPPVFVSASPVEGESFFVMADADGGPVTEKILDHTALLVSAEGRIERRGGVLVFRMEPKTLTVLP